MSIFYLLKCDRKIGFWGGFFIKRPQRNVEANWYPYSFVLDFSSHSIALLALRSGFPSDTHWWCHFQQNQTPQSESWPAFMDCLVCLFQSYIDWSVYLDPFFTRFVKSAVTGQIYTRHCNIYKTQNVQWNLHMPCRVNEYYCFVSNLTDFSQYF